MRSEPVEDRPSTSSGLRRSKNRALQERRTEDTTRVVGRSEPTEIGESWIKLCEVIRAAEDFCPVRPWLEGLKRGFDLWHDSSDGYRIGLPGEMDSEDVCAGTPN